MPGAAIGNRSYHQQPESPCACSALPQYVLDLFVAQLAAFAAMPQLAALPEHRFVLPHVFGRELLLIVGTTRTGRSRSAEPQIGSCAAEQFDAVQRYAK